MRCHLETPHFGRFSFVERPEVSVGRTRASLGALRRGAAADCLHFGEAQKQGGKRAPEAALKAFASVIALLEGLCC